MKILPDLTRWYHRYDSARARTRRARIYPGKLSPTLLAKWLVIMCLVSAVTGCGPGRGAGRRRGVPKLTPLVYKQHVPNVSENTLGASGQSEGRIARNDSRIGNLIPNYNADIIFKDEEGTGADRLMTQRCYDKLNTLAISVMNQWPGVKLRVTEGWDEEGHHANDSLHYEGRAVDLTTSDRDRSKYGMLAKLAVEAGFDWVYYESRAHIHCSVRSESSQSVKSGGCFPASGHVKTRQGPRQLSTLQIGDEVLVLDSRTASFRYSEVLLFLDRDPIEFRDFLRIETASGRAVTLTPSHLVLVVRGNGPVVTSDMRDQVLSESEIIFASQVEIGDKLVIRNSGREEMVELDKVVDVRNVRERGVFAPLTAEGTIVVNDVTASCYAVVNCHGLAHFVYGPLRLYHNLELSLRRFWETVLKPLYIVKLSRQSEVSDSTGIHWYAEYLYRLSNYILPKNMLYSRV